MVELARHPYHNALYVHLPFCAAKCAYCDFYSIPDPTDDLIEQVAHRLVGELSWFRDRLGVLELSTVYIGGGTPSLLPTKILGQIFKSILDCTSIGPLEWTIEANPETLSYDFLAVARDFGVTRVSLGVQSFSDRALALLQRRVDGNTVWHALEMLESCWEDDISLDLIFGIPGQTAEELAADLSRVLSFRPDHVSAYSLSIEKGTPLAKMVAAKKIKPLDCAEEEKLALQCEAALENAGYDHYEVSNFCLPQKPCLHNLGYWQMDPYIGIGPAAVGTLPGKNGAVIRLENPRRIDSFLAGNPEEYLDVEQIPPASLLLEHLMMGLRIREGIKRARIISRFGSGLETFLGPLERTWRKKKLVETSAGRLACTRQGWRVLNHMLKEAAAVLAEKPPEKAVWP